jgi:predicted dehydrogenase
MGYMYRYSPAFMLLRKFLRELWLGDVFEVHTVMSKVVGDAERRNLAQYSGGIMFELGCHVIDQVISVLGKPDRIHAYPRHSGMQNDGLLDNMLAVFEYPRATASVKSAAIEVDGGNRRHFVVCGTRGTFHIQPLDNPSVRLTLDEARGEYRKGTQEIALPKFTRYVADAADMAAILRGEKACDFSYEHDLIVQETVLRASGVNAIN